MHVSAKMKRLTARDAKSIQSMDEALPDFYIFSKDHPLPDVKKPTTASPLAGISLPQGTPAPMLGVPAGGMNLAAISSLLSGQQNLFQIPTATTNAATLEQQRGGISRWRLYTDTEGFR